MLAVPDVRLRFSATTAAARYGFRGPRCSIYSQINFGGGLTRRAFFAKRLIMLLYNGRRTIVALL
jgi:hypothetical protein